MEHVGIDLGAKRSHVAVVSSTGEILERVKIPTMELSGWLRKRNRCRVVMEACTQSPALAAVARAAGHEVFVVPGHLVRALGVGARGIKTDDRDALVLALASARNETLPSVHLRSDLSRTRRELLTSRSSLVEARKGIGLSVKSWLRGQLIQLQGRVSGAKFCDAVRQLRAGHPDGLPLGIESQLQMVEHLSKQIDHLDAELKKLALEDAVCVRLMTVPGIGPNIALSFVSHIDDISRFANADELASFLALVPGENTTGGKLRRSGTIMAGPLYLKALLVQGAWSMWRTRPNDPAVVWARSIREKRGEHTGKGIAIVALARKISGVLYALWKHGTTYDPSRASRARASSTKTSTPAPSRAAQLPASSAGRTAP